MFITLKKLLLLLLPAIPFTTGARHAYDSLVNQAELCIINSDYKQALTCYDRAFTTAERSFAQDLYNAGLCAIQLNDDELAVKLCLALSEKGVGPVFFAKNSIYKNLKRHKDWNRLLTKAAQDKQKIMDRYGNIIAVVDSLVEKDQKVNHEWRSSGMIKEKRLIVDLTYDTISAHLNLLFDSLGFLSEEEIGATIEQDTLLRTESPFDVIIIHKYQSRMQGDSLFSPILRSALQQRLIKPDYYARIQDFSGRDTANVFGSAHFYVQYKCTLYRETKPVISYERLEQARRRIGMSSLADYEKKIRYRLEHKGSRFLLYAPISVYGSFADEASEQHILSTLEVVTEKISNCTVK